VAAVARAASVVAVAAGEWASGAAERARSCDGANLRATVAATAAHQARHAVLGRYCLMATAKGAH
jgi:hypothetical protein